MWTRRSKRTTAMALGLVAVLAGVAVAYFLTTYTSAGNAAKGGQLTVTVDGLPLNFTDTPLYPTDAASPQQKATKDFGLKNENPVSVSYEIYAACPVCQPDPTDTAAQATDRANQLDQFNNLYVKIYTQASGGGIPILAPATDTVWYTGKLSELTPDKHTKLSPPGGASANQTDFTTYKVDLWLANTDYKQEQNVVNDWTFFIDARTPA